MGVIVKNGGSEYIMMSDRIHSPVEMDLMPEI